MTVTAVDGAPNKAGELDIPENVSIDEYGEFTVTEIGRGAFSHRDDITAVQLLTTVVSANGSFNYCHNLKYAAFLSSVCNEVSPSTFSQAKNLVISEKKENLHDRV